MSGKPLATNAVAAAAVAFRAPEDFSVVSFAKDSVVVKSQDGPAAVETVVDGVLSLRGHGTTDLAGALARPASSWPARTPGARSRAAVGLPGHRAGRRGGGRRGPRRAGHRRPRRRRRRRRGAGRSGRRHDDDGQRSGAAADALSRVLA